MSRLRTPQKLEDYWIRLNEIENLADALYRALLAEVFDSGSDVVTMIKIKAAVGARLNLLFTWPADDSGHFAVFTETAR
jgi:hypothetical protein